MKTADLAWFKSSYSDASGGNCLEVAYDWRKSSHSTNEDSCCVGVAAHPTLIHIRDSKDPHGPQLAVSPASWAAFLDVASRA
ncbi:DUF397 domain-containing protein [Streptomyces sp. NK15101]|uniref:DUF397 domain-containing protein n=1 Tax=Streptomyces sp. NK15101 TaxID=2873261 RepID=UPI001CED2E87|nr:DUF397 domain-containing protein [Streptomyces sp. NK15101]